MFIHQKGYDSLVKILGICLAMLLTSSMVSNISAGEHVQYQVTITGFKFVPKELHVMPGDTITWVNHDIVPHSIVISSSQKDISPVLDSGETFTYIVEGNMAYECGLHPPMKGKLTIP
ncbi:MAG: hypothetical protein COB41_10800 [Proteobacteria bacterium]|nr:MAG: hypothetical protein COB41_10800 [Pseudomonadota bacterium]